MTPAQHRDETGRSSTYSALRSLVRTQLRLSHEAAKDAAKWEADGNYRNFASSSLEARRLRRDARFHLNLARSWRD